MAADPQDSLAGLWLYAIGSAGIGLAVILSVLVFGIASDQAGIAAIVLALGLVASWVWLVLAFLPAIRRFRAGIEAYGITPAFSKPTGLAAAVGEPGWVFQFAGLLILAQLTSAFDAVGLPFAAWVGVGVVAALLPGAAVLLSVLMFANKRVSDAR